MFFVCKGTVLKGTFSTEETQINRLDYGFERRKMLYFSLWEEVGFLQGELKKGLIMEKSCLTLEWLIQHECVNYAFILE